MFPEGVFIMSAIILKILSVIGIILLVLLGILLLILLLVLFFPISYRLKGHKAEDEMIANAKVDWLFGLLRVRYAYPEPGRVLVKFLWITLFDSKGEEKISDKKSNKTKSGNQKKKGQDYERQTGAITTDTSGDGQEGAGSASAAGAESGSYTEEASDSVEQELGITEKLSAKYKKIKYTILKIYDKIKWIWEHITFYKELWEEQETQELFKYALQRLSKIWKNIKPKKLEANLLYGASSPDTTGYIYAVYGMICSYFGEKVIVTPDFTRAVLEGNFYITGRITVFVLLWNAIKVAFDKRLKRLVHKVKRYEARQKKLQKRQEKEREQELKTEKKQ